MASTASDVSLALFILKRKQFFSRLQHDNLRSKINPSLAIIQAPSPSIRYRIVLLLLLLLLLLLAAAAAAAAAAAVAAALAAALVDVVDKDENMLA